MRDWHLRDREECKGAYEQLIRRGLPQQMMGWIDGALLVDIWDELDLAAPVREAWKWPLRLAVEPVRPEPLGFGDATSQAEIRGYAPLPKEPRTPRVRFLRTRFDPHPGR